jgi:CRP-like cAMP-binding protein
MSTAKVLVQSTILPQRVVRAAHPVDSENLALIRSSALFQGLTDWECQEIAYYAGKRVFARNQALFVQGEPIRDLILLKTGSVKHTQVASNGNEVLLRFCTAGDFANVFTGSASYIHTCSARTTRPTVALVWDFARMHRFLEQCPRMRDNISRVLAVQLHQLENRFRELATECVSRRLALVVSRLALQIGRATSEGILISITREELAQMTGTTVFSVSRQLSIWSAQGSLLSRREEVIVRETNRKHFDDAPFAAMHCSSIRLN